MESTAEAPRSGFWWGAATSSYQIEGGVDEDGRGPSIWDTFTRAGDHIVDGSTGDIACDHYHRWADDVALLAELGVGAYRFSINWPRIQPTGAGPANPAGIAFYDRLVDALLERGIAPAVTLYHWELPQALQDAGGWSARDTALRFGEYAATVAAALGDRVALWLTLNEMAVHTVYGHIWGMHAPGQQLVEDPFPVVHHQLLAHGLAVAAVRAHSRAPVGAANNYSPAWAVGPDGKQDSATDEDRQAALLYDLFHNRLYTDPILTGAYPAGLEPLPGSHRLTDPQLVRDGDLATIAAPTDALGVNYYNPTGVGAPSWPGPLPYDMRIITGYPMTYFGWPVVPDAFRDLLLSLRERYGDALPPIYVTENGCAYEDVPGADGTVDDQDRIAFHQSHIDALTQAIRAGVDVRGYFAWSLIDNFEWAEGYTKRFGLVHVDFATLKRTPKASFAWYRDHIRSAVGAGAPSTS
ncbi:MAG TPA: GH1 family beta-glucosidase [Micromonosporaceae bacterium]|nr:GH1 family beta-glucosidase [Micromonosporaceae bacterium]